jgi:hypothetical protein
VKTKGPDWHARHDRRLSGRRLVYLARFAAEPVCFIRRKKARGPMQDATSIQPLSRLL